MTDEAPTTNFAPDLHIAAYDCETWLIAPGLMAPPLVCMTTAEHVRGVRVPSEIYHRTDEDRLVYHATRLHRETDLLVGANTAFDAAVIMAARPELVPIVFEAYAADRVLDVQFNEKLLDIAKGRLGFTYRGQEVTKKNYSLAALVRTHLGKDRDAQKSDPDGWRMRYRELDNVKLHGWPRAAIDYAIEDSDDTLDVLDAQFRPDRIELWQPIAAQVARTYLALHLLSAWGIKTDARGIDALELITRDRFDFLTRELQRAGLVTAKGSRNTKKAKERLIGIYRELGQPWPLTDTGYALQKERKKTHETLTEEEREKYASLDAESCDGTGDELLSWYAERTSRGTIVETHIPDLRKGLVTPLQSRWDITKSSRVSCQKGKGGATDGFQLTNPARAIMMVCPACQGYSTRPESEECARCESKGEVEGPGVRECFRARRGWVYIDADYSGLELCTVAQACKIIVGYSTLGDALNAGIDPHLALGVELMNVLEGTSYSYEDAVARKHEKRFKFYRQLAKVANFGFPGGLGAPGFVAYARGYGVRITVEQAKKIKAAWLARWPEFVHYFREIGDSCDLTGDMVVRHLFDGHIRGGAWYTAACNSNFQGLGARVATHALWHISRACYDPTIGSVLLGSRPVNFVHDQVIAETPYDDGAHDRATELGRLMTAYGNEFLPDYPVQVEPHLAFVWSKNAEPVYDERKRLVPWDLARDERRTVYRANGKPVEWPLAS